MLGIVLSVALGAIVLAMRIKSESLDELLGFKAALDAAGYVAGAAGEPQIGLAREGLEIDL